MRSAKVRGAPMALRLDYFWTMRMKDPAVSKKAVLKSLKELPERMAVEDIIERVLLLSKIEEGVTEAKAGKGASIDVVERRVRSWSK